MPPYFLTDYPCSSFRGGSCDQPTSPCTAIQVKQECPDPAWWFWMITAGVAVVVVTKRSKGGR